MTDLHRAYRHTIRAGYTLIVHEERQTARFVGGPHGTLGACYDSASAFADRLIRDRTRSPIAERVQIVRAGKACSAPDLARVHEVV